ncbi:MAG: hypothetical protein GY782_02290 [Gammaproteobacteria bacterium]|nr:hypothetical protein [Gammaproteobacteria bacterium]
MWILSIFVKNVVDIGPYYGKNGSSRFQKRLNYAGNTKKTRFFDIFEHHKNQKSSFQTFKSVIELMGHPLEDDFSKGVGSLIVSFKNPSNTVN